MLRKTISWTIEGKRENEGGGREEKNGASQDTAAQKEWVDITHNGDVITWKK